MHWILSAAEVVRDMCGDKQSPVVISTDIALPPPPPSQSARQWQRVPSRSSQFWESLHVRSAGAGGGRDGGSSSIREQRDNGPTLTDQNPFRVRGAQRRWPGHLGLCVPYLRVTCDNLRPAVCCEGFTHTRRRSCSRIRWAVVCHPPRPRPPSQTDIALAPTKLHPPRRPPNRTSTHKQVVPKGMALGTRCTTRQPTSDGIAPSEDIPSEDRTPLQRNRNAPTAILRVTFGPRGARRASPLNDGNRHGWAPHKCPPRL